jgi:hypothetical protein
MELREQPAHGCDGAAPRRDAFAGALPAMARDDQRFMTALEAVAPGEIVFDET